MKTLIFHNNNYKYFTNSWQTIGTTATESDYISFGIDDISTITEEAWTELDGVVELCTYTDESNRVEVLINVDTEPFTLLEEWGDKQIQIIEYTDIPTQEDSLITLETEPYNVYRYISDNPEVLVYTESPEDIVILTTTEPYDLYDEFGDEVEVLVYTDNESASKANLIVEANWSPIDELEGENFDIVTYVDSDNIIPSINYNIVPKGKLIIQTKDIVKFNRLKKIKANYSKNNPLNKIKVLISGDKGLTWKSYKHNYREKFVVFDINDLENIRNNAMNIEDLSLISEDDLKILSPSGNYRLAYYIEQNNIDDILEIDSLITNDIANDITPELSNISVYYDSIDQKYFGIMFLDKTGNYYSNNLGELIQYLDFGYLIAGQTSEEVEIILKNSTNYNVENIKINVDENLNDINMEFSKTINPFIAESSLNFNKVLNAGEQLSFYVRLTSNKYAENGGVIQINVLADPIL